MQARLDKLEAVQARGTAVPFSEAARIAEKAAWAGCPNCAVRGMRGQPQLQLGTCRFSDRQKELLAVFMQTGNIGQKRIQEL